MRQGREGKAANNGCGVRPGAALGSWTFSHLGELAASVALHLGHPARPRSRGGGGGPHRLQAAPRPFLCTPGLLAMAGSSGQRRSSGRGRARPCSARVHRAPVTRLLHLLSAMPCILLWAVPLAGKFDAPIRARVPSVYSRPVVSAEPKAQ